MTKTLPALFLALLPALTGAAPVGPLSVYLVEPCRFLDTRNTGGPEAMPVAWVGPMEAGQLRFYRGQVEAPAVRCGVPLGARAMLVNVVAVNPTEDGHVVLFSSRARTDGTPMIPATSNLNFSAGRTVSNSATVPLCLAWGCMFGDFGIAMPNGKADIVIDLIGYLR